MKEAYAIYMSVKKLSFQIKDAATTLQSNHLPLMTFLQAITLNAEVNNQGVKLSDYII